MNEQKHGWLTNPLRKRRRDRANTLTNEQVQEMLNKIDAFVFYISDRLTPKELDHLVRLRDRALISLNWIWFKRASEILSLKRKDCLLYTSPSPRDRS